MVNRLHFYALFFISCAGFLCATTPVHADTFLLASGGRIEGDLLNPDEKPRKIYIVRTNGGVITLPEKSVNNVKVKSDAEMEYEQLLPRVPNNAEGHTKMADWCQKNRLRSERFFHLEKVLGFEPNNEPARHALGYSRVEGRWIIMDDFQREQGYVRQGSSWRLRQEVAIEEATERGEKAQVEWRKKVRMWRGWVGAGRRHGEAMNSLSTIDDWRAGPAIAELMDDEPIRDMRLLYVEICGRINGSAAITALVKASLEDTEERVREAALAKLIEIDARGAMSTYRRALKDSNRLRVNRAAFSLAQMNDQDAVQDLIDVLTSTLKTKISEGGGNGQVGASFSPNGGGGGLTAGGKTKYLVQEVPNVGVFNALREITGGPAELQYNRQAWRDWFSHTHTPPQVNLRRRD